MANKKLTAEDFKVGTLVLKTGCQKGYGFVVERGYWLDAVAAENYEQVRNFYEGERGKFPGYMIPIVKFGDNVSRFTYSNIGGDIITIPRFDHLNETLSQMLMFVGRDNMIGEYIQQVYNELKAFKSYLEGKPSNVDPVLGEIFDKAVPRDLYFKCQNADPEDEFWKNNRWKYESR